MKHFVSFLAVLTATLVIGCEDSGLLEPNHVTSGPILLENSEPNGASDLATPNWAGTSEISQNVEIYANPGASRGVSREILIGTIDYFIAPSSIRPDDYISFWTTFTASLLPSSGADQVIDIFRGKSEDHLFLSVEGVPTVVVIAYEGTGSMTLYVEYKIDRGGFAINSMWIVDSPNETK